MMRRELMGLKDQIYQQITRLYDIEIGSNNYHVISKGPPLWACILPIHSISYQTSNSLTLGIRRIHALCIQR
jgi:hypothetical protein